MHPGTYTATTVDRNYDGRIVTEPRFVVRGLTDRYGTPKGCRVYDVALCRDVDPLKPNYPTLGDAFAVRDKLNRDGYPPSIDTEEDLEYERTHPYGFPVETGTIFSQTERVPPMADDDLILWDADERRRTWAGDVSINAADGLAMLTVVTTTTETFRIGLSADRLESLIADLDWARHRLATWPGPRAAGGIDVELVRQLIEYVEADRAMEAERDRLDDLDEPGQPRDAIVRRWLSAIDAVRDMDLANLLGGATTPRGHPAPAPAPPADELPPSPFTTREEIPGGQPAT